MATIAFLLTLSQNTFMIRIEEKENIVYTVAEKKLNDEDYGKLLPVLHDKVEEYGMIRWYFEMRNFKGWSLSAMWKDVFFDFRNRKNLEKVAMVGDKKWEEQLTKLMEPFSRADIRFFKADEKAEARKWINETY